MGNQGSNFGFGGMAGLPSLWGGSSGGPMGMYGASPYGTMGGMQQMPWLGGQVGQQYNPAATGGPGMQGNFGAGGQNDPWGSGAMYVPSAPVDPQAIQRWNAYLAANPNARGQPTPQQGPSWLNAGVSAPGTYGGNPLYNPQFNAGAGPNSQQQATMGYLLGNLFGFPASHSSMMDHPWARTTQAQK